MDYFTDYLFFLAQKPPVGQGLLIHEVSRSHTTTHHTRQGSSGRVISSSQRPPPDNIQHSRQTSMPLVGFEPTISPGERPQTYALDRAATGTSNYTTCDILQGGARKTGPPSRRTTWAQVSDSVQEIKQMQMQSTYWLEKALKMISELTPLSYIACMTICCSVHKSSSTYKEIIFSTFSNQ